MCKLTSLQKAILRALSETNDLKLVAIKANTTVETVRTLLYRIVRRYREAREYVNFIDSYRRYGGLLDKLFYRPKPFKPRKVKKKRKKGW